MLGAGVAEPAGRTRVRSLTMADPLLFRPYRLRRTEVRNRLWVSPMCQYSAEAQDGVPTDWHLSHLGALARGGAGMVIMEATGVVPEGRISPFCLGLWNDDQEAAFARLAEVVHAHGAKLAVQLGHAGRKASTYPWMPGGPEGSVPVGSGGWPTVAPSAAAFDGFAEPRALEREELPELVRAFVAASSRAVRAGLDAVEIHAAHGYLLHQFLSPLSNFRTDAYGGALENRARLLREVVCAVRAEHPELPILVRISATDWLPGGFELHEAQQVAAWLAEDGADLVDCSTGGNAPEAPIPVGPSYQVHCAAAVRDAGIPTGAVGLITEAAQAEGILVTGQADVVLLGRALLRDPHLPLRWAHELRAPGADALVPRQYWRARF